MRAAKGKCSETRGGKRECEARKRSGIEATKGVRRIGSKEKDWWWTKNPEESFSEEERNRRRRATY